MQTRSMLFVDDHPVYREGFQRALASELADLRIVTASNIADAMAILRADGAIDFCLTDQRLPDGEGTDFIRSVRRLYPAIAIGLLSAEVTPELAELVRVRGGIGCLSKGRDCGSIAAAIQVIFDGGEVFDGDEKADSPLSDRRRDIVRMAAEGKLDKQISVLLQITESTVRNHWHHIFDQLGASNRTEAVTKALRRRDHLTWRRTMRIETFPEADIARESTRLFFRAIATETFFVAFSTLGAFAVGIVVWKFGKTPPSRIVLWCGLVGLSELALTAIDRRFVRKPPPEARYGVWTWVKTGLTALHGLTWGLGPILLHQTGDAISTLAPAWAVIIFTAGVVYSCASVLPCIVLTLFVALAPAALWLVFHGTDFDRNVAVCMATSLPFTSVIGLFAARSMRASIISRLEIASLLAGAQAAQRERARFYSSASHDLRQPVHALGFYTSLLQTVTEINERREVERRVDECAKSLDRQFNAILGVAEVDRAVQRANVRIFALQPIFDTVAASIKPDAFEKNIRIRVVATRLFVQADPDLLERVIRNLAVNAVHYTRKGSVLIGVRRSGKRVRLCVLDSGIGIPDVEQERIFEDFYQVGNRERARDKGFGLGLSIVRRLCIAMEWDLEVSSIVGRGSQFTVSLESAAAPAASNRAPLAPEQRPLPDGLVVLVVDDDPLVRDATNRLLAQWNVRAEVCATSADAMTRLGGRRTGEFWHALLDCRLAGAEDGFSLALRLRALSDEPLRITLMSGDADGDIVERGRQIGVPVMRKPMKAIGLRALLSAPFD